MRGREMLRESRKVEENELNGKTAILKESTLTESIESLFLTFTDGLRGVLLVMSKSNSSTLFGATLQTIIEVFQLLALAMLPATVEVIDTDGYLKNFASFFQIFEFGTGLINLFGFKVALGIVTGIVWCELLITAYVAQSWIKKTFEQIWAIRILRFLTSSLIGVLYIPMVSVMGVVLSCSTNDSLIEESLCVSIRPFVCVILGIFVTVSLIFSSAYITSSPASGSPSSKAHSRVDLIYVVIKTVASLLLASLSQRFPNERGLFIAWHGFLAASGILLALLNVWYLPWFHPTVAKLRAISMCIFGWVAFAIFASVLSNESSSTFLFVMTCVGVIPFFHSLVGKRRRHLSEKTLLTCRDSFEFELMIRQKLLDQKIIFNVGRQRVVPEQSKDMEGETLKILLEIDAMYNMAMKQFPSSDRICAFYAEFSCAFDLPSSNLQVRKAIIEGESRQPGFVVSFTLFKLRHRLQQRVVKDGDVMAYVASEKYENEAVEADKKACSLLLDFWRELGVRHPDMSKVRKLAAEASKLSHQANVAYQQLVKVKPKAAEILNLYSGFLANIANDRKKAVQISQRIQMISSQNISHQGNTSELSDNFPIVSFDVVGEDCVFGEILSANEAAGEFLNESNERLIRRDLRSYFLPEFSEKLTALVSEFFESGTMPFLGETKQTFVITTSGDCAEVDLRLIPYTTDGMEYCFFATWTHTKYSTSINLTPHCFLLVKNFDEIVAYSHECRDLLVHLTIHQNPDSIDELFIDFKENIEAALKRRQYHNVPVSFRFPNPMCGEVLPGVHAHISIEEVDEMLKVTFHPRLDEIQHSPLSAVDDTFDENDPFVSATEEDFSPEEATRRLQNLGQMSKSSLVSGSWRTFNSVDAAGQKSNEISSPVSTAEHKKIVWSDQLTKTHTKGNNKHNRAQLEDDNQSHASMGSSSSVSAAAIRSALQSQSNDNRLSPILARLKRSYIFMLLVALGCASLVLIVQDTLLAKFVDDIHHTTAACLRRGAVEAIAFAVHSLLMHNVGIQLPHMFDESSSRESLLSAALSLKSLDEELFNQRTEFSEDLRMIYEIPSTPLLISLNSEAAKTNFTMYEACSMLTAKAIQAYESDLSEFTVTSDLVFTLVNNVNGEDNFLDALYTSSAMFGSEAKELHKQILKISLITICVAMAVEIIVLFAVMNPIVSGIEQNKTRVLDVFAGIPLGTVKEIATRYLDRLTNTHGVAVEGLDEDDGHQKHHAASSPTDLEPVEGTTNKKTAILPAMVDDIPTKKHEQRNSKQQRTGKGGEKKKRKPKATTSRYFWFLLQLGSAVILSGLYFGLSLQYGQQKMMNRFGNVPQQINDFTAIRAEIRYALHMLRLFTSQTDFELPGYDLHVSKSHLIHVLDTIQEQRRLVVNGDESSGVQGLLHSEVDPPTDLLTLMFSNGCHRWSSMEPPVSGCENFASGVLRTGLNTAITGYTDQIQVFMKKFADDYTAEEGEEDSNYSSVINNSSAVSEAFMSEDFVTLAELAELYLKPQLSMLETILSEEVLNVASASASIRLIGFVVYICSLLLLYFMVVRAVIKSLDYEVKQTRSLLLMIPEDSLDGLKSVQKFLTEEFKNSNLR